MAQDDIFATSTPERPKVELERAEDLEILLKSWNFQRFMSRFMLNDLGLMRSVMTNTDIVRRELALELYRELGQNAEFKKTVFENS